MPIFKPGVSYGNVRYTELQPPPLCRCRRGTPPLMGFFLCLIVAVRPLLVVSSPKFLTCFIVAVLVVSSPRLLPFPTPASHSAVPGGPISKTSRLGRLLSTTRYGYIHTHLVLQSNQSDYNHRTSL
ncbi:hypothetical protein NXS19_008483 [Fusarium pseudograminearum]|nr:hypothetical protein NXS19_008483 [Fusarium pseudograminearum]